MNKGIEDALGWVFPCITTQRRLWTQNNVLGDRSQCVLCDLLYMEVSNSHSQPEELLAGGWAFHAVAWRLWGSTWTHAKLNTIAWTCETHTIHWMQILLQSSLERLFGSLQREHIKIISVDFWVFYKDLLRKAVLLGKAVEPSSCRTRQVLSVAGAGRKPEEFTSLCFDTLTKHLDWSFGMV